MNNNYVEKHFELRNRFTPDDPAEVKIIFHEAISQDFIEEIIEGMAEGRKSVIMEVDQPVDDAMMLEFENIVVEFIQRGIGRQLEAKSCTMRELFFNHVHCSKALSGKESYELFYNPEIKDPISNLYNKSIQS